MPIALPNLDDREYADLVEEALAMIPAHAPEWTNHNASDPGITLIEMFAYLTEMLLYRLNRVTDANKRAFLKLLTGEEAQPGPLTEEIGNTVLALRQTNRAVTVEDFETLALAAHPQVARARCVPRRNLRSENPMAHSVDRPGHVSVVILPHSEESNPQPTENLIQAVSAYLDPRRLLTTRVDVVGPRYMRAGVRLTLVLEPDAPAEATRLLAVNALRRFLHPLTGGPYGTGWPFGRDVYLPEIYELLDKQSGVDCVTRSTDPTTDMPLDELTAGDEERLKYNSRGELLAVEIQPDELPDAPIEELDLTVLSPLTA